MWALIAVLYGIADCELHAFVESDNQQNVQRLYWVQFEGYLPSKPELHHAYDSPRHLTIGGMDFYVDTWTRSSNEKLPDSAQPTCRRVGQRTTSGQPSKPG